MARSLAPEQDENGACCRTGTVDRVTWVGHSTALVQLDGTRLLTDPLLRGRLLHLRRRTPPPSPEATARIDAVLVSHMHGDHMDLGSLRRIDRGTRLIVPRGAAAFLRAHGLPGAEEIAVGETIEVGALKVTAVSAEHDGGRRPFGGPQGEACGYVVEGSRRVYFAGDTDLFGGMEGLAGADVALLPVWGWGPSLGEGHLDPDRAAEAVALLEPRVAIPIHWGTYYPVALHRWKPEPLHEPPRRFAERVARLAPGVEVRILEPGDSTPIA
jgi:L-ascorbate metabolism protein UlaG (beta-lactamase superfamily)